MNLKRILAAVIAASAISTSSFAFTPYGPDRVPEEPEQETSEETADESENEAQNIIQSFKPTDYQYRMFEQILDAYVEKHLYEFTEEEVLHKFFEDFLTDNPMYFSYFMDYILGTMDPYSSYHEASSGFLDAGSDGTGFGFIIKDSTGGIYIDEVIEGSNAAAAGFMAGDKFVSVAGINVEGQTFDVVTTILAKPADYVTPKEEQTENTESDAAASKQALPEEPKPLQVEITVDRNGEKHTFSLSRGPMTLSQISSTVDNNNDRPTAYIQVSSFLGDSTDTEFTDLVTKYAQDGIKHLTIDLRDNGGGSLDYALAMAEVFLEKGEVISYYVDRNLEEPEAVYSTTDKVSFDSITILINENSASAAELFTSILRDKGLAKVVGTKSFGKSLGQEVYTLANGDYITITTYQMLNENLESYDGIGIIPDLVIEDVEMIFELPALGVFNHQNYVEIKEGQYSDVTKALEDRLVIMGVLREQFNDGVFDDVTKTALYVMQKDHGLETTGFVDYKTVSLITRIINSYKTHTYYDNTQYEVAMIVHHSFSQGKRLVKEKERLREEQEELITARDAAIDAAIDAGASVN